MEAARRFARLWLVTLARGIDRRSRIPLAICLAALLTQSLVYTWLGLQTVGPEPLRSVMIAIAIWLLAGFLRKDGRGDWACMLEVLAVLLLTIMSFLLLQYSAVALSGPLADPLLLRLDTMLGFDWASFAMLFSSRAWVWVLNTAYASLIFQGAAILIFLCANGQVGRAWQMLTSTQLSLMAAVGGLLFFAADGSYVGCRILPAGAPYVEGTCRYGAVIHALQSGELRIIGKNDLVGLGSFPSFHVSAALIYVWATWKSPVLRWLFVPLNLLLAVGAIVIGHHYFVDIPSGVLIAAGSIVLAKKIVPDVDSISAARTSGAATGSG